jgi:hypothetical protein
MVLWIRCVFPLPSLPHHTNKNIDLHHLPDSLLGTNLRKRRRTKRDRHHHKLKHTKHNSNNNAPPPILFCLFFNSLPRIHTLPLTHLRPNHKPTPLGPTSHESLRFALTLFAPNPPLLHLRPLLRSHSLFIFTPPTLPRRIPHRIPPPLHLSASQLLTQLSQLPPQSHLRNSMGRRRNGWLWLLCEFPSWT